ncbi:MAG: hypothetical protein ACK4UP_02020 [Spirosomataceae bacterium]
MARTSDKKVVFTLAYYHQIPSAVMLMHYTKKHNPEVDAQIWLVDSPQEGAEKQIEEQNFPYEIRYIQEIYGGIDLTNKAARFTQKEWKENSKPAVFKKLLQTYDLVLYADNQSVIFSNLTDIFIGIGSNDVLLVPELMYAEGHKAQENTLNRGIYSNQFILIQQTETVSVFLDWWEKEVEEKGIIDVCKGYNADRYFLEIAPSIFPHFVIYRHPGVGICKENQVERKVEWDIKVVNAYPLVSYTFASIADYPAGLEPILPKKIRREFEKIKPNLGKYEVELPDWKKKVTRPLKGIIASIHRFFDLF